MQNVAFILIGLGIMVIIGWVFRGFFMAEDVPVLLRAAVGTIGAGVLVLIGVAVKDRINRARHEDYKEIKY